MLQVGPLDVVVGDPFGLTARRGRRARASPSWSSTPASIRSSALPVASGHDPQATARHPNALGRAGDDFYALRPYQVGDDLRRVHWPATAHHDELMIRQHELPWQERTTVLLDVRATAHVTRVLRAGRLGGGLDPERLLGPRRPGPPHHDGRHRLRLRRRAAATSRPASSTSPPSTPTRPPRCSAASTSWRGTPSGGSLCSSWPRWPPPTSDGSRTCEPLRQVVDRARSSPRRGIPTASTRRRRPT